MRERELLFNDYLADLRHKEKNEKHQKKEQVRKNFHSTFYLHLESKISHNLAYVITFANFPRVRVCEIFNPYFLSLSFDETNFYKFKTF